MSAAIFIFPQARRVGFCRKLAHRAVSGTSSARAETRLLDAAFNQQRAALERRGLSADNVNPAISELRAAVAAEIRRLRPYPTRGVRK